jgi:hypothetical protein
MGAATAPVAGATPGLTLGFSGDADLTGGTSASRAPWIGRAVAEGASIVRVNVEWSQVAPKLRPAGFDPANPSSAGYNWSAVDPVVRDLTDAGLRVLITLESTPAWAEGAGRPRAVRPGTWRPDPRQFGAFATAAALRYNGNYPDPQNPGAFLPQVRIWQAWNEPNLDYYLSPQWVHAGHGWAPEAPVIYRQLLNSFYASVKRVSASNFVVTAGTSPYGDVVGSDPVGQERTPPLAFYRDLFCLNGASALSPATCPDPAHFDALDHHPYGVGGPTWHALNADDVAVPDLFKIGRVLKAALRTGHALPTKPKSLWVSEIGWSSNPPNPQGVPVAQDALWLEQAMYVLWSQGVDTVLPLEIGDPAPIPSISDVFESGLYYRDGHAKPVAQAFRFPFTTERLTRGRIRAWGRPPQGGALQIQALRGKRWITIDQLAVRSGQPFVRTVAASGRALLRAQVGSQVSLTWSQGG